MTGILASSLVFAVYVSHNFIYTEILGVGETSGDTLLSTLFTESHNIFVGNVEAGSLILIVVLIALIAVAIYYGKRQNENFFKFKNTGPK